MRKIHIRGTLDTLTSSTARTLVQAVSAGEAFSIVEAYVSFQGSNNGDDASCLCELVRQTSAGTGATGIVIPGDPGWPETLRITARMTLTVEPTTLQVGGVDQAFEPRVVHPKGGSYTWRFAVDECIVGGSGNNTRLGLRVTPGTLTGTVKAIAGFIALAG